MSQHNHCDDNKCCSHSHGHEGQGSCHEHEHECKDDHHSCEGDFSRHLLEMADCAWMELLKEKIKKQIESSCGAQLDELAKLVSETNHVRWKHKIGKKKLCNEYQEKIAAFFSNQKC